MARKPNQAAKGTRKPKRTAQEVAAILAAPVPPDGIETFREGMREEADKAAEMVAFRLAEGKIDANAAAFILTANRRIVSKHESELQRKITMREIGVSVKEGFGALRQDFADVGDTMCEIVGKKRIPPEWKEIDEHARRELYELVRRIKAKRTGKRGALETFMDKATWTFRGFTVREIFKDTLTLDQFYNAERMKETRKEKRGDA